MPALRPKAETNRYRAAPPHVFCGAGRWSEPLSFLNPISDTKLRTMPMCSDLKYTPEGKAYSCRRCDDCIATRRADWVSRCMAEKATSKHTLVLALTYNDETPENRSGAMMFRYSDIQAFVKRLREAIHRETGKRALLRYVCAGEQGDRNGRCHWHIVLYSEYDLTALGEITAPWGVVTKREHIVTRSGQKARRRGWTMWPHGMVTFQEPDEGGIKYAISYALKDQFGADRAKGQNRESKSETWATGLFRPSKKPPIGFYFLERIIRDLAARGAVLPHTNIPIPESAYYWRPAGALRNYLLTSLREINEAYREQTGRNCPQWPALLKHCENSERDREDLGHGQGDEEEADEFLRSLAVSRDNLGWQQKAATIRRCGANEACTACLRSLPGDALSAAGIEFAEREDGSTFFRYHGDETGEALRKAQATVVGVHNDRCQKGRSAPEIAKAFPHSARSR